MKAVAGSLLHNHPPVNNEGKYISFPVFSVTYLGYLSAAVGWSLFIVQFDFQL